MSDAQLQHWPDEQLEFIASCPACHNRAIKVLESDLIDRMVSPPTGLWCMNCCGNCGIAYLSPRPNSESIGAAYSDYFTHTSEKGDLVNKRLRLIKRFFSEKYYAAASKTGSLFDCVIYMVIRIFVPVSLYFDAKSRHIFNVKGKPGRLLDVGCGNGEFLKLASKYNWNVVGVDFDECAVTEAQSSGLDVRVGGIDVIDDDERFDFISLSHVIEHVYNPVELVQSCYALLNDGGTLWLETPNIESVGYVIYGSDWRGLEPPRHIMLFNQSVLREILSKSGFSEIEQKLHGFSGIYMGLSSEKLLSETSPSSSIVGSVIRKALKLFRVISLELIQFLSKRRREFITLVAVR